MASEDSLRGLATSQGNAPENILHPNSSKSPGPGRRQGFRGGRLHHQPRLGHWRNASKDGKGPLQAPARPSLEGLLIQRIDNHKDLNRHLASQNRAQTAESQHPFSVMPPFSRFRSSWVSSAKRESSSTRLANVSRGLRLLRLRAACHRLSQGALLSLSSPPTVGLPEVMLEFE